MSAIFFSGVSFGNGIFKNKEKIINPIPAQNWSVSSYGFLIFPTGADLEEFIGFMETKTHGQAQAYLDSLGFSSLGASLYTDGYTNQSVSREQAINYSLNNSRIIQLHGIIIKPVSEADCEVKWQFVLAMSPSNLSSSSYNDLTRGTYDENLMNKYATNPPTSDTCSLPCKMAIANSGHEDTEANPCPENSTGKRPFWGWSQYTCTLYTGNECWNPITNTPGTCYLYCPPSYYIFWICVTNCGPGACTGLLSGAPCPPTQ